MQKFTAGPFTDGSTQELDVAFLTNTPVVGAAPKTFGKPGHGQAVVTFGAITPAPPPPPPPSGGPVPIKLAPGMKAITAYTKPLRQYTGPQMLSGDWTSGLWNYGFQATQYQPEQLSTDGTNLLLTAVKKTSPEGYPYMSGWATTDGKFDYTYGQMDVPAQMPAGQGLWSGIWLLDPSAVGKGVEIDDVEVLLGAIHTGYGSLHASNGGWHETQAGAITPDAIAAPHVYSTVWEPGMVTWAIDGQAYAQYTKAQAAAAGNAWTFDGARLRPIINLAVAAAGEWGGAPNAATVFPAVMKVPSLGVWQ